MQENRRKARGEGQTFNLNAMVWLPAEGMVDTSEKVHTTEGSLLQWQRMSLCHMPKPKLPDLLIFQGKPRALSSP